MTRLASIVLLVLSAAVVAAEPIVVASKNFNESYILGEAAAQLLESAGFEVERRMGLGGTLICYEALIAGEIDVYVEYTGTLSQAILKSEKQLAFDDLNASIAPLGLEMLPPVGFNNTYALAMPRVLAERLGLETVSDLAKRDDLDIAFSHEFLEREDGWPGLARLYGFDQVPNGIEHGLAYQALADGAIDVTDAYSTDGELVRYDLKVLADDRHFFPSYLAAPLVRLDLPVAARSRLARMADTLDDASMQAINASVMFGGADFASAAAGYLDGIGLAGAAARSGFWEGLRRNTARHIVLTAIALAAATCVGIALGLMVFRIGWLSRAVVYMTGLMQTIPSIALLALMIPIFGIGIVPAIAALFLYSLLPIVRNTVTALVTIDPVLRRVSTAMGLTRGQELRYVFVPLSMPSMLAGVRTAAVICIGTATLAAFIGAGGLGDPIVTGLSLNDTGLIMQGAVPAALLAVATELVFEGIERALVPKHLRTSER